MKETKCVCQRAEKQKHGEMLPAEYSNSFNSSIHVYENEAYIAVECDMCERITYIKITNCPYCGRKLKDQ